MTNALSRLNTVVVKQEKYTAKVLTVNSNGTTTVEHSNGSKEVVIGNSVATGSVYISDGVIVGEAAELVHSVIYV